MTDFLINWYLYIKALHIMSVIAWMAGLFYLPRLFVHHVETAGQTGPSHDLFIVMENKLLRVIMNPAMISTWLFGLLLVATPGIVSWDMVWPWTKAIAVLAMTGFHMWLAGQRRSFVAGEGLKTGRTYRMMNELPTLLMVVIVLSVVVKF
ncbi:CopD family protein [Pseudosulfitobacter koreensis]|uniref:Protoporphyrinogen IX oxidase n=1 Tax=Pseudosulfitobacter koreensis TaxID=2968472 RepID=A0ABT1YX53_9RHOB|nr:CopD family protein [Pseudosulfitobacter koreense]MCR8825468.1 CopD family protein [Pseudosulfitobacter koreense]